MFYRSKIHINIFFVYIDFNKIMAEEENQSEMKEEVADVSFFYYLVIA